MPVVDYKTEVQLGEVLGGSGHLTRWAKKQKKDDSSSATLPSRKDSNAIFKANKHGNPALSELEVAMAAVWKACVREQSANYYLVTEGEETKGVLSDKLTNWQPMQSTILDNSEHKEQLATLLVMCYCLEEDDLHKNNIGTAEIGGKTQVIKIDHDMSFYQSLSSTSGNRRPYVRVKDEDRFVVSARDMTNFPVLTDANIHYWPTTYRFFEGSQGYGRDKALRNQFRELKDDIDFTKYKFKAFEDFAEIKPENVKKALEDHLGSSKPELVSMIMGAFIARQAEIRCVLLATPEAQRSLGKELIYDNPLFAALETGSFKYINLSNYKNEITMMNELNQNECYRRGFIK